MGTVTPALLRLRVQQANTSLSNYWSTVSNHLRMGLAQSVGGSSAIRKMFVPPDHFPGADGKSHRKPIRALYGFGQSAQQRFDYDMTLFNQHFAAVKAQIDRDNAAVDYWVARARSGDADAIGWYCKTVLPFVLPPVPGGVGGYLRTAYSVEDHRQLVIDRHVPGIEVIPEAYRYEIHGTRVQRSVPVPTQRRDLHYQDFLSQVALLTLDRLFRCEISNVIDTVTINCLTAMLNPATGHVEVIAVLSARVSKDRLGALNLFSVNSVDCVVQLNARLTKLPGEYAPVVPIAETERGLVTVTAKDTPLLEMNPSDFEELVTELLRRMGLRAQKTGQAGDGGVDCEAFDDRPVVGGKVVVQVKRYANIVAPTVVRDLFGTVHATGATKGVLVTTSGFGPESKAFVQGKPLELIDGVQFEALLRQHHLSPIERSQPTTSPTEEAALPNS